MLACGAGIDSADLGSSRETLVRQFGTLRIADLKLRIASLKVRIVDIELRRGRLKVESPI